MTFATSLIEGLDENGGMVVFGPLSFLSIQSRAKYCTALKTDRTVGSER